MLDSASNSEVHAAHIFAVAYGGPDVVQNGLALCGTVHWLFDHYLISLTDDHRLLVATDHVPAELRALMIGPGCKAYLPAKPSEHPHPKYLRKHRDRFTTLHGTK
jgi:putative restriction endonuclease